MTPEAIVFDLDGVLLDSEQLWDEAKHALVTEAGGTPWIATRDVRVASP